VTQEAEADLKKKEKRDAMREKAPPILKGGNLSAFNGGKSHLPGVGRGRTLPRGEGEHPLRSLFPVKRGGGKEGGAHNPVRPLEEKKNGAALLGSRLLKKKG